MPHAIVVPRLGWSMEEGVFVGWLKQEGEGVQRGEALFQLEGDKAIQEIEAVDEGILRLPANAPSPGTVVAVGSVVGYLVAEGEAIHGSAAMSAMTKNGETAPAAGPAARRLARQLQVSIADVRGSGPGGRVLTEDIQQAAQAKSSAAAMPASPPSVDPDESPANALVSSPRARRVALELGVDWKSLVGSGARGRVREADVRKAAETTTPPAPFSSSLPSPAGGKTTVPISGRRRVIAERLAASRQQSVPVTLFSRADASNLVNLREQFKAAGGPGPIPSFQIMIAKLVAEMLARHPLLASCRQGDTIAVPAADELHIGLAVDAPEGLLVPVLRDVRRLSVSALAEQSERLIERARAGTLSTSEVQGGVFTITNLGAFGVDEFTPVINPPQAAILGLGAVRLEPTVLDNRRIAARRRITLSLTFDHCLLDGAPAARFLQDLVRAIANPAPWFLNGLSEEE